jgi:hypothetical protein
MNRAGKVRSISIILLVFYVLFVFAFVRWHATGKIKSALYDLTARLEEDLGLGDVNFNIAAVSLDKQIPSFQPVYIIGKDGLVYYRQNPVSGFLDRADTTYLTNFSVPKTVVLDTGENWRLFSKTILEKGQLVGVVAVGIKDFENENETDIRLYKTIENLERKINIGKNGQITIAFDARYVTGVDGMLVVNKYNEILFSKGNLPYYLDRNELKTIREDRYFEVKETLSNRPYLFYAREYSALGGSVFVVAGRSIQLLEGATIPFVLSLTAGVFAYAFGHFYIKRKSFKNPNIRVVEFDETTSTVVMDGKDLKLPFSSNQHYLIKTLFRKDKWWENDELVDAIFGEDADIKVHARKVYDAARAINTKSKALFGRELVLVKNKRYKLASKY